MTAIFQHRITSGRIANARFCFRIATARPRIEGRFRTAVTAFPQCCRCFRTRRLRTRRFRIQRFRIAMTLSHSAFSQCGRFRIAAARLRIASASVLLSLAFASRALSHCGGGVSAMLPALSHCGRAQKCVVVIVSLFVRHMQIVLLNGTLAMKREL